jgi:aryl-alcohol dehydrogenase
MRLDGSTSLRDASGLPIHSHVFGQSSFAARAVVPVRNVVKVDSDLPLTLLGPLGCGIQTGAGTILNVLKPRSGTSIAVIGAGAVGMSAIMAAALDKANLVVAIDLKDERLALAKELGAEHAFLATLGTVQEIAEMAARPAGFDYIIDTTGNVAVVNAAISALAPRGELAMVGAYPPLEVKADATFMMSGGRSLRGVVEGSADPQSFIPELIALYRAGKFPFDRLVEYFPFEDIQNAIEAGETGRVVKPIIVME